MSSNSSFFTYKNYPLVRKNERIYYGNMSDPFVALLIIKETKDVNGIKVATKVSVHKVLTEENLSPIDAIIEKCEQKDLYSALNVAYNWLTCSNDNNEAEGVEK